MTNTNFQNFSFSKENVISLQSAQNLLNKKSLLGDELVSLLIARENNVIDFILIDTREVRENKIYSIKGSDYLFPTSVFNEAILNIKDKRDVPCIVYCLSGARSAYCQETMYCMGFSSVSNIQHGLQGFNEEYLKRD